MEIKKKRELNGRIIIFAPYFASHGVFKEDLVCIDFKMICLLLKSQHRYTFFDYFIINQSASIS